MLVESGADSLSYEEFVRILRNPIADATLLLAAGLAVVLIFTGFALVFILADEHQSQGSARLRPTLQRLRRTLRKLVHPQSLLLVIYLLIVLPLGQVGLIASLTSRVAVPPFVTDELAKSPVAGLLYALAMLVLLYLNLRLLFVLPLISTTDAGVLAAIATSWRLSRRRTLRLFGLTVLVGLPHTAALVVVGLLACLPTAVADEVAPDRSLIMAATGLAVWQVALFVITALATTTLAQSLIVLQRDGLPRLSGTARPDPAEPGPTMIGTDGGSRSAWPLRAIAGGVALVVIIAGSVINAAAFQTFDVDRTAEVIAHRGWVDDTVENTVPALRAAKRAGADRVEFDVQETKDGKFVVIHDSNLSRLAGLGREVKDLTQAELTKITVRDGEASARIPSLEEWIETSRELDLPQLLEVKLHGGESPELVPRLLAVLDSYGVADWYTYHSLSRDAVTQLKEARPSLRVGYIIPINLSGIPNLDCDFVVIEQASYDDRFLQQARESGRRIIVWTVQSEERMQALMIDGVDGIITDHPDTAIAVEHEVAQDEGLTTRLIERLVRTFPGG
ncbi:glycerophosphoryl diester phosphodiesterase membrane domain-containing protein [Microlunatus sp. GCM10028923]|uniref:glycerophosphoryl diester phosphodiesterase membrane domain-containing protein n=1 Tax=Microlunatus sp. GCM10028923 TaxID=3273400 RepID=UPI003621003C